MTKRFQFIMLGAILTLVVVIGSLAFAFSQTQASDPSAEMRVEGGGENGRLDTFDKQRQEVMEVVAEKQALQDKWTQTTAKPGWLHTQVLYERPQADYGTLANGVAIPSNYQDETWYLIDEAGQVTGLISLMQDLSNTLIQYAIFRDGKWWNSVSQDVANGDSFALPWSVPESMPLSSALLTRSENLSGEIVFTTVERFTAIAMDDLDGAMANGQRKIDVFDSITGQNLSQETFILLADGTEQLLGRYEYLLVESVEELPDNINVLFHQNMSELQEATP